MYSGEMEVTTAIQKFEEYNTEMEMIPMDYANENEFQIQEGYYYQSELGEIPAGDGDGGYTEVQYIENGMTEEQYLASLSSKGGRAAATGSARRKPAMVMRHKKSLTSIVDRLAKKKIYSPEAEFDKIDQELLQESEDGTAMSYQIGSHVTTPPSVVSQPTMSLSRGSSVNEISGEDEVLDLSVSSSRSNSSTPKYPPVVIEEESCGALDLSVSGAAGQRSSYKQSSSVSLQKDSEPHHSNSSQVVLDLTRPLTLQYKTSMVHAPTRSFDVIKNPRLAPPSHFQAAHSNKLSQARHLSHVQLQISPRQELQSSSHHLMGQRQQVPSPVQQMHSPGHQQLPSPGQQMHSIIIQPHVSPGQQQISPGQQQISPGQLNSPEHIRTSSGQSVHLSGLLKQSSRKPQIIYSQPHQGITQRLYQPQDDPGQGQSSQDIENTFRTNKMLLLQFLSRHTIQQKISGTNVEVELLNCRYCKYASTEKSCMMAHLTTTHVSKKHSRSRRGTHRYVPYSQSDPQSGKSQRQQQMSPVGQPTGQLSPNSQQPHIFVPQQQLLLPSPPIARQDRSKNGDIVKVNQLKDGSRPLKYHQYRPPSRPQDQTLYQQQKADAAAMQHEHHHHRHRTVPSQATAMQSPGQPQFSDPSSKFSVPHISPQIPHQLSPQLPVGKGDDNQGDSQSVIVPQITSVYQITGPRPRILLPKPTDGRLKKRKIESVEIKDFSFQEGEDFVLQNQISEPSSPPIKERNHYVALSKAKFHHTLVTSSLKSPVSYLPDVPYSKAQTSHSQNYDQISYQNQTASKQPGEYKLNNLCKKLAHRVHTKKEGLSKHAAKSQKHDIALGEDGKIPVKKDIIKKNRLKLMTQTGVFTCKECHKTFDRPLSLFGHLKQHSPLINKQKIEVYQCTHCPKAFNIFQDLVNHLKSHSIVGEENVMVTPVEYTTTGKRGRQSKSSKKHSHSRNKQKLPFKCNYCGKAFKNVRQLCGHLKLHGGVSGTKFVSSSKKSTEHIAKAQMAKLPEVKVEVEDEDDANKHYGLRKKARRDYRLDHDPMQDSTAGMLSGPLNLTNTMFKQLDMAKIPHVVSGTGADNEFQQQIAGVKEILKSCKKVQKIIRPFFIQSRKVTKKSRKSGKHHFRFMQNLGFWNKLCRNSVSRMMVKQTKKLRTIISVSNTKKKVIFTCKKCGMRKKTQRSAIMHIHKRHVIKVYKEERNLLEKIQLAKTKASDNLVKVKKEPAQVDAREAPKFTVMNSFKQEKIDCVAFFEKVLVNSSHQFQCKMCFKVIKEQCFLARHLRTHRELPNNPAIMSLSVQNNQSNFPGKKSEVKANHNLSAIPGNSVKQSYACSKCPYLCFTKMAYTRHMMTHNEKKAPTKSDAIVSMQNVNPYCCNLCSQGFSKPKELVKHLINCKAAMEVEQESEDTESELIIDEEMIPTAKRSSVKSKSKKSSGKKEGKFGEEKERKHDGAGNENEFDEEGDNEDLFQMQTMVSLGSYYDNTYPSIKKGIKKKLKGKFSPGASGDKPVIDADLVCKLCENWMARNLEDLDNHLIRNHGAPRFDCKLCESSCPNYRVLLKHLRKHTKVTLECDQCNYQTVEKRFMIRHVQTVHEQRKPYTCELCEYSTAYKHHLKRHYKSHCVDLLTCSKCSFCTLQDSKLQDHVAEHEISLSNVMCDQCCLTFPNTKLLQAHLADVHNRHVTAEAALANMTSDPKKPEEEDSIDLSENSEEATSTFKTRFEKYSCTGCPFIGNAVVDLTKHLIDVHVVKKETVKKEGGKKEKKGDVKRLTDNGSTSHILFDRKEAELVLDVDVLEKVDRSVQCPQCGLITSMDQLENHLSTHSSGETYACEHCPFESQVLNELQHHLEKKHSKNKETLTCQQCQKVETDTLSLRDHSKTHLTTDVISEQNLFKCSLCPYMTHLVDEAGNHLDQHNYVMEFKCQLCMYSCTTSSGIASHRRLHRRVPSIGPSQKKMSPSTKSTHSQSNRNLNQSFETDNMNESVSSESLKLSDSPVPHLAEGSIYDCRYCDLTFAQVEEWQRHERRHHLEWA